MTSGSCCASGSPLTLTKRRSSDSVLSKAKARCWMRCLGQSCMRKFVNFLSSEPSHFTTLVDEIPPSSNTLSGRWAAPFGVVSITSDTAKVASSEVRLVPLVYSLYCRFAVGVPKLSPRYFSMSASATFRRRSLTTDMSVGGSALVAALVAGVDLRPKMFFYMRNEVVECFAVSLDGFATAHRALPDMRFKLTRECFAFHRLEFLLLVLEFNSSLKNYS